MSIQQSLIDNALNAVRISATNLTVTTTAGTGTTVVSQTAGPWAVSGTVSVGNVPNVNQTGAPWAVSGTVSTNPHAVWITGPAAVSGTVSTIAGGTTAAHGSNPTAVAAGTRADSLLNRAGIPFVMGGHPNIQTLAQNYTSVQTDQALVTVATGLKIVVTSVMLKCNAANTVNVSGRIGFGTTTVPAYGSAGLLLTDPGIAPGSGIGRGSGAGILGVGGDDQDVRVTVSAPTGGSVDAIISYFTVES